MNTEKTLNSILSLLLLRMISKLIKSKEEELFNGIIKDLVGIIAELGIQKGRSKKETIISTFFYLYKELTQYELIELTKICDSRDIPLETKKGFSMGTISTIVNKFVEQGYLLKQYREDKDSNSDIPVFKYYYSVDGKFSDNIRKTIAKAQLFLYEIDLKLRELNKILQEPDLQSKKGYNSLLDFCKNMTNYIDSYRRLMSKYQNTNGRYE